jgi:hypothetical protein
MQPEDFLCYSKKNKVLSVGMNLNNIVAKHYYSENVFNGGRFRQNLNIPLPLVVLNHENSFFKNTINHENTKQKDKQKGKQKGKQNTNVISDVISYVISDSMFDKLIDLKSKTNMKKSKKKNRRKRKKTKKLLFF